MLIICILFMVVLETQIYTMINIIILHGKEIHNKYLVYIIKHCKDTN